jgi:phage head maturation protease
MQLMKRGDVNQMSFAFTVGKEDQTWTRDGQGPWLRTIKKVSRLFDVSVVTYPAYPQTSAAVRALEQRQADDTAQQLQQAKDKAQREARGRHLEILAAQVR